MINTNFVASSIHNQQKKTSKNIHQNHLNLISIKPTNFIVDENVKSLKIASFNAQSLGSTCEQKRILLKEYILDNNIDIMFIQETWFNPSGDEVYCAELAPPGYTATSYPRSYHGGGLAIVFRNVLKRNISIKQNFDFAHKSFEIVQLNLKTHNYPITFFNIYRTIPRKSKNNLTDTDFHDEFHDFLSFCNQNVNGKLLILGDFNIHFDEPRNPNTKKMIDLLNIFDLVQSVNFPTQKSGHILDWILSRQTDNILSSTVISHDLMSDHNSIICELSNFEINNRCPLQSFRNIKGIDREKFRVDLNSSLSSSCDTIDDFNNILRSLIDIHAPQKFIKMNSKSNRDPVHDSVKEELIELKKLKRKAEKRWLKTDLTVHKEIFDSSKKDIAKLVQKGRSKYYNNKIINSTTTKELHSVCKDLTGCIKEKTLPSHTDDNLPETFSNFFSSKIDKIRQELDQMGGMVSFTPNEKPKLNNLIRFDSFQTVTEDEVKKIMLTSKPTTCPLDPVPTNFFLEFIDETLPTITNLINDSLLKGYFPDTLKTSIVRPLLKKPSLDQNALKNYRPVSTLSFISKIYEKVVLSQLIDFLNKNNLLSPNQSAYRKGHSTETALVRVVNDILLSLDQGDVSILTLLDLSSAFDTIDQTILLHILQTQFYISGAALSWFESYLISRNQSVMIDNLSSKPITLRYGVPQGSVIGPILFIMYTKSLYELVSKHSIKNQSFADDTQLYHSSHPKFVNNSITSISACFSDIKQWMYNHKLKLNDEKTEALLIHSKSSFSNLDQPSSILIGSSDIPFSKTTRNLGYIMTDDMSSDAHINFICRSAYGALRRISAIRKYLTVHATTVLVCAFVLSRLDYIRLWKCSRY